MAHQLQSNDYMASGNNIRPWHGLGAIVEGLMTAQEALIQARLGWTARKHPITLQGSEQIIPDSFAVTRDDDNSVLGIVGNSYQILQNADAFNFFDSIAERGDAVYETAGSLFGGRKIFITAKIPGLIRVGSGEDISEKYILLTNNHDGTGAVTAKIIVTRVVCNNTLTAAMRESGRSVSIRHSSQMHDKLAVASEVLGIANSRFQQMEESFNQMAAIQMKEQDVKNFLMRCFEVEMDSKPDTDDKYKNQRAVIQCLELHESGKGSEMTRGTLWGAFNAITEWTSNYRTYKDRGNSSKEDNKVNSIFFGQSSTLTDRAMAEAGKIIKAGAADVALVTASTKRKRS